MSNIRNKYQVHAEVHRIGHTSAQFDDAQAGYPLARRMHRIERVASSYRGRIDQLFNNALLMVFETADAALLGACEMQQRCAGLAQAPGQRLALRIGIHQVSAWRRASDEIDDSGEIASQLALADDDIVVSEIVVAELNPDLRKLTRPLDDSPIEQPTHRVDWRCEIPSSAYGGEALWPASKVPSATGPYLILHQGLKTLELTEGNPLLTIGRAPSNDLVLTDILVSRKHCQIERHADRIVLTDWSTNGTCIMQDEGAELLIKNDSLSLRGKGLLFFGRRCDGERRGGVRFETD